jgi:hypothetical protein
MAMISKGVKAANGGVDYDIMPDSSNRTPYYRCIQKYAQTFCSTSNVSCPKGIFQDAATSADHLQRHQTSWRHQGLLQIS